MADKTYSYTGGVQSFTAPATGTYTITALGGCGSTGSGGGGSNSPSGNGYASSTYIDGGYGGTVVAKLAMTANQTIYIAVGGSGGLTTNSSNETTAVNGGWNGGAAGRLSNRNGSSGGQWVWGGAGAGATSITTTNRGVLTAFASYQGEVLMVAGGGGGGSTLRVGGGGGGTTGGDGAAYLSDTAYIARGGTQTAGGAGTNNGKWGGNGSFGAGGACEGSNYQYQWPGGGGGAGWYGGGGGCQSNSMGNTGSGAGGSGYINTSKMTSVSNTRGGSASNWGSGHGNVTIDYPNITVSYNTNGGSTAPGATTKKAGTAHTLPAAPTKANYNFAGWYTDPTNGTKRGDAGGSYTPTASETLYAHWTAQTHKLDLNGWLDGVSNGGIGGFGTADVYVNGTKVATGVGDFYQDVAYGSTYEIKNIVAASGKKYMGVHSGSLTGTMGSSNISVSLSFMTMTVWVKINGTWKQGIPWVKVNGTWKSGYAYTNNNGTWKKKS